jgi:hypothetical protein
MTDVDVPGPIDYLLLEFPGDRPLDRAAAALMDLVEQGTIRLYDLVVLRKEAEGTVSMLEIDPDGSFAAFVGARSGLLGEDDATEAGAALEVGTTAVLLVYENVWAIPFAAAALEAGGQMVASARIPVQDVVDALDRLELDG